MLQTQPTYLAEDNVITTASGRVLDVMLTSSGARYGARMLNAGACHVETHRPLGTRVQPGAPRHPLAAPTGDPLAFTAGSRSAGYAELNRDPRDAR